MNDESSNEHSQTKAAATNMIIRIGSCATVIVNIANDGPNARNVQPKNSGKVIFAFQLHCSSTQTQNQSQNAGTSAFDLEREDK